MLICHLCTEIKREEINKKKKTIQKIIKNIKDNQTGMSWKITLRIYIKLNMFI